ncbi:MAG: T9SS type A sorting domain-containing protein [Ignavibacteriales bacterium]|nr:MAG: T9SS type A sorting domain-containing protein [Ignavibacteriales bacterium]
MAKGYSKPVLPFTVLLLILSSTFLLYAYSTGVTGETRKNGNGCFCHAVDPTLSVNVVISGPTQVQINSVNTYTVTISGGPLVRGGTNIAALTGSLANINSDLQIIGDELTHVSPKSPSGGSVTFQFQYTAPGTQGFDTLFANGNSVNFNGFNDGDQWNFADNFAVQVMTIVPVELTNFSASINGRSILLRWTTGSEINNKGFEVERQIVSSGEIESDWINIALIEGAGNSTSENRYTFEDKNLNTATYRYRLKQTDFDGSFTYYNLAGEYEVKGPESFVLDQNFPNPFNPSTTIGYYIDSPGFVELKIFNTLGKEVGVLKSGYVSEGYQSLAFDGSALSSGVYYYQLKIQKESGSQPVLSEVKKMVLMK